MCVFVRLAVRIHGRNEVNTIIAGCAIRTTEYAEFAVSSTFEESAEKNEREESCWKLGCGRISSNEI